MNILVEVCAASVEDALVAERCGAHRIELNTAMPLGGLTPSLGLVKAVREAVSIPIIAMVRPRESGFCYSDHEFDVMRRDIDGLLDNGANGIAVGMLDLANQIDFERCQQVRDQVPEADLVFHRAFDFSANPRQALESLIELKFDRIMTSGGKPLVIDGLAEVADLVRIAGERIGILPASGINPENVSTIVHETGVNQVHGTFSRPSFDGSAKSGLPLSSISSNSAEFRRTNAVQLELAMKSLETLEQTN